MLVLHIPDALQHSATNSITQVFRCRLRVDITQIDSAVYAWDTYSARSEPIDG